MSDGARPVSHAFHRNLSPVLKKLSAWRKELLPRIALLLSLAILPIGIIAVLQTRDSIDAAERSYRANLSAQTARIATPEREAIIDVLGVARNMASAVALLDVGDPLCQNLMDEMVKTNARINFAGLIDPTTQSRCNSEGRLVDFSSDLSLPFLNGRTRPDVSLYQREGTGRAREIFVSHPVFMRNGDFLGMVSVSFAGAPFSDVQMTSEGMPAGVIVTFDGQGRVLTSDLPEDQLAAVLPTNRALSDLVGIGAQVFSDQTETGQTRDFALLPILTERAYVLGSWEPLSSHPHGARFALTSLFFPLVMWVMSLVVALLAIHRQVVRPIGVLGNQMHSFATERRIIKSDAMDLAPMELHRISDTFERMAHTIMRDEAGLEQALHEREVLLKEVHHRVKNNLQLMSSIMNMQARRAQSDDVRAALQHVQDRLTSLGTVYRGLYEAPEVSRVRMDALLEDLLRQLMASAERRSDNVALELDMESVALVPDQAQPLAMLAAEAFSNALTFGSCSTGAPTQILVSLHQIDGETGPAVMFRISNSLPKQDRMPGPDGLGHQLIGAFVQQLDGALERKDADGQYCLYVRFDLRGFEPEPDTKTAG